MSKFREHHLFSLCAALESSASPADLLLRKYFHAYKSLGSHDRRFLADTLYGMIRWRGLLDQFLSPPLTWEKRYALYTHFDPLAHRERQDIPSHSRVSFPKALFDLLASAYGIEKTLELCYLSNTQAPPTIRVNSLKIPREELLAKLQKEYKVAPTLHSSLGIVFRNKLNFAALDEFKQGFFEVQDEGSQLVAELVQAKPGDKVLDFCAGSGGKSLALAPAMQGKGVLFLHDIRSSALQEAKKRLKRAGIQNAQILSPETQQLQLLKKKVDWVLVDVPCSGTGTLRRNPDLKWKFNSATLERLQSEQQEIFAEALQYLHPQGRIVYATCSLLPQENEDQVALFQKKFSLSLESKPLHLFPQREGMDGFFGAVLKYP